MFSFSLRLITPLCMGLMFVGGAHGQSISVSATGTLGPNLNGGPDPLLLNGAIFTATTSIPATSVTVPPGAISFTYTVNLTLAVGTSPIQLTCNGASVTVNSGATSSIVISNCALPLNSTFTATINFAANSIPSPIPLPLDLPVGAGSQASYTFNGSALTVLGVSGNYAATCSGCGSISATPSALTFSGLTGGTPPPAQNVLVTVASGGTVNYASAITTFSGGNWLSVSPTGGLTGTSVAVTANPSTLPVGTYMGSIKIYASATDSPLTVPVTFTVTTPFFTLHATPSSFSFASINGSNPASQSLFVTTAPTMPVVFTASASSTGNWLSVSPTSGITGSTSLSVTANPTGLPAGSYSGSITLTAAGAINSPLKVPVTFDVSTVTASSMSLTFTYMTGGRLPPPQSLSVNSTGPVANYTALASTVSGGNWLAVSPGSGTTNGSPQSVSVTPGSLAAGAYSGTITIITGGATASITVPVTLTITLPPFTMIASPPSFAFNGIAGNPAPSGSLSVTTSPAFSASYTASAATTDGKMWLLLSSNGGTTGGSPLTVTADPSQVPGPGTYNGVITLTCAGATNSPLAVLVSFNLLPAPTFSTLYMFSAGDGADPVGNLTMTGSGVLYGITQHGGSGHCSSTTGFPGCGTVYSLTPPTSGSVWTEAVLHSFAGGASDGFAPASPVLIGRGGVLYGTTAGGGASKSGIAYSLTPPASMGGTWTEALLHSFSSSASHIDGLNPTGMLSFSKAGIIYSTTENGGASAMGTVFTLSPPKSSGGSWGEKAIYSFSGKPGDGATPVAGVVVGSGGVLYGTTTSGGSMNWGTVFSLTPPPIVGGAWTESILYNFAGGNDGGNPYGGVALGPNGVLYGTTNTGGSGSCFLGSAHGCGTVYSLTPPTTPGGAWTESVLYSFLGGSDGQFPYAGVTIDSSGLIYGTTSGGGSHGSGTVFLLTPPVESGAPWTEAVLFSFTGGSDGANPLSPVLLSNSGVLYGTTSAGGTSARCTLGCGTVFSLIP